MLGEITEETIGVLEGEITEGITGVLGGEITEGIIGNISGVTQGLRQTDRLRQTVVGRQIDGITDANNINNSASSQNANYDEYYHIWCDESGHDHGQASNDASKRHRNRKGRKEICQ